MEGKVAVASVIMNRVKSDRWPSTVQEVVFQTYQFSSMSGSLKLPDPQDISWKESLKAVIEAKNDPSTTADHFDDVDSRPPWSEGSYPVLVIGKHAFYKISRDVHRPSPKQVD